MKPFLRYTLLACALSLKLSMRGAIHHHTVTSFTMLETKLEPGQKVRVVVCRNGKHINSYTATFRGISKHGKYNLTGSDGKPKSVDAGIVKPI